MAKKQELQKQDAQSEWYEEIARYARQIERAVTIAESDPRTFKHYLGPIEKELTDEMSRAGGHDIDPEVSFLAEKIIEKLRKTTRFRDTKENYHKNLGKLRK